jgi:hypothetical protein
MQKLIENAKPLASTLLRVHLREDLRTALRLRQHRSQAN